MRKNGGSFAAQADENSESFPHSSPCAETRQGFYTNNIVRNRDRIFSAVLKNGRWKNFYELISTGGTWITFLARVIIWGSVKK